MDKFRAVEEGNAAQKKNSMYKTTEMLMASLLSPKLGTRNSAPTLQLNQTLCMVFVLQLVLSLIQLCNSTLTGPSTITTKFHTFSTTFQLHNFIQKKLYLNKIYWVNYEK